HGARRTAETFGKTAFAVIALIVGGFCTLTFADKTSAQQLPQTSISRTAESGGFAEFRKQQQARLLSHIDDTLAAGAEKAIGENFGIVKRAGVHLQSGLGGRKSGGAINIIGAFAESDSHAFGWQLRAYAAEGGDKGGNVGLFYRQTGGGILYGANVFGDYEDGDYGDFLRYGIGGELSHSVFSLAANYYIPQTDNRLVNATVAAFSREGYDAKLRLNAPGYKEVKAAIDYYRFDGKGKTENDKGWRYGLEFVPIPSFHFALYYDDSAETIGGDIGYSHTIGKVQKRESNAAFSPDLFAAVSREYSQRIVTMAITTFAPPVINTNIVIMTMRTTTAITAAAITTTARMTAAAITTTTRMTAAAITTRMTILTPVAMATRMARVHFTARYDFTREAFGQTHALYVVITSSQKFLVTLPSPMITHPLAIRITGNIDQPGEDGRVIMIGGNGSLIRYVVGHGFNYSPLLHPIGNRHTLNIVQGSEEIIGIASTLTTYTTMTMAAVSTTTTMTMAGAITETPMTMAGMATTTRITTFSTMFITLTANTAMGDMGDSRFRGNDDIKARYSRNGGNPLYVIALKGRPVHSTGQRPVTALPINQALKGRPILLQGKARQKPRRRHHHNRRHYFRSPFQGLFV
ncbi:MAG: inverse autotransporter beta domain-containing protein, partial [Gammaproteobacteria bacterium]